MADDLSANLKELLKFMVMPLDEIDKTSKLVLSLSTGALVLIIGVLKDPSALIWARLFLGVSALLFACSLFRWLSLARLTVDFREGFAQAMVTDLSKDLLVVTKSGADLKIDSVLASKYFLPLPQKRAELSLKFVSQCNFFVSGVLVALGYLIVLMLPIFHGVWLHR